MRVPYIITRVPSWLAIIVMTALIFLSAPEAAPAQAGETAVAVVDVARVIDASVPGKAGQRHIDEFKKGLDGEYEAFKKNLGAVKDDDPRLTQRQAQLAARYQAEFSRVTELLAGALRRATSEWLKGNKRGVTLILPAGAILAAAPGTDVGAEILPLFNAAAVDFGVK